MAETSAKLNRTTCSVTRFKIPDNMLRKDFLGSGSEKMTPTGKIAYALVNSLSKKNKPAFLTYDNFHEVLRCSTKTTRKFLLNLTESGKLGQDKSNRMYSKYTVLKKAGGKGYITHDYAYLDIIDKNCKTPVHWTNSRKLIAFLLVRHIISNPKGNGKFAASINQIANMTGISPRTARAGISHFLKCKVIFRPAEYKGKYEGKPSEYTFGTALTIALMKYEEKVKEEAKEKAQEKAQAKRTCAPKRAESSEREETSPQDKPLPKWQEDIIAADMRSARERFFEARRQKKYARANKFETLAMGDEAFKTATTTINKAQKELAEAELYAPQKLPEIEMKVAEAQKVRAEALLRLNLTEEDLLPQWTCKKCSDTGYLPNGKMCDCYTPPGGDP